MVAPLCAVRFTNQRCKSVGMIAAAAAVAAG
jgi:hypothetical protein